MKCEKQIPVAIYGSSLFLTAVATVFRQDGQYKLIFFSESMTISTILHHNPALLLYQANTPPTDIPVLLAAGLVVVEIMPDKNQMTLFQHQTPPQCVAVRNLGEFQTKIAQFIAPYQQINPAIFNATVNTRISKHD